jgi:homospermidine synthase
VLFGFGAIGKSIYELIRKEISFNEDNFFVIDKKRTPQSLDFFCQYNGGRRENYIKKFITKSNFTSIFGKYLSSGDLLIDLSTETGSENIIDWCVQNNVMYVNTADNDWPEDVWRGNFEHALVMQKKIQKYNKNQHINKHPIVLQHGNNCGLVSHFTKMALRHIVQTQFPNNARLNKLANENKYNLLARDLGLRMVQVSDNDVQQINVKFNPKILKNTWSPMNLFMEGVMKAEFIVGNHEVLKGIKDKISVLDTKSGYIQFKTPGVENLCTSYDPSGEFRGFIIPHEEIYSIARHLTINNDGNKSLIYRPTVLFVYYPCDVAFKYMQRAKLEGYVKPKRSCVIYEGIVSGCEYVGVFLLGEKFDPVWAGNRLELGFIKKKGYSGFQTPTITPVAAGALGAICWMLKNKNKKGIFYPDDIIDFDYIVGVAEKYISKTIYATFKQSDLKNINFNNIQLKDFIS